MAKEKKGPRTVTEQSQSGQNSFNNTQFLNNVQNTSQQLDQTQNQSTQGGQSSVVGTNQNTVNQTAQNTAGQTATGVDAASQAYIDLQRQHALGGFGGLNAAAFRGPTAGAINQLTGELANPHTDAVVGAVGDQYDRLRDGARMNTQQEATMAGAYGGSRHGIAEAQRLAEMDRAEAAQVAGIRSDAFNQARAAALPIAAQNAGADARAIMAQQELIRGGMGPTGTTSTQTGTSTGTATGSATGQQTSEATNWSDVLSQLSSLNLGFGSSRQTGGQSGTANSSSRGTSEEQQYLQSNPFGAALGGAMGLAEFGTPAGLAGAGIGLLSGLFG